MVIILQVSEMIKSESEIMNDHVYDYIIVGSGISGLQAAEILTQYTHNILILEAQQVIGGRIQTMKIADSKHAQEIKWVKQKYQTLKQINIEKGATFIQESHTYLKSFCHKHQIQLQKLSQLNQENRQSVYLTSAQAITQRQLLNSPQYQKGVEILKFVQEIDKLAQQYKIKVLEATHFHDQEYISMLKKYDSMTVKQYLDMNIQDQLTRQLVQSFLEHKQCAQVSKNSMHQVLTKHARSNDVGILKAFLGIRSQGQPSYLVKGGTSSIIQKYVQSIEDNIKSSISTVLKLNSQVLQINNDNNFINNQKNQNLVMVKCLNLTDQKQIKLLGRHVICSAPLSVLHKIDFTHISQQKQQLINSQLNTKTQKTFLIFQSPFWQSLSFNGDCIFSSQYPINMSHDISPQNNSCGILVMFHAGEKYDKWKQMWENIANDQKRYLKKVQYLRNIIGKLFRSKMEQNTQHITSIIESCYVLQSTFVTNNFIESGFQSNTINGAFSKISYSGSTINSCFNYKDQKNLTFIGSQFSSEFPSYMQGAVRSACSKVENLLQRQDKQKITQIQQSQIN